MDMENNNHSVFRLNYLLILTVGGLNNLITEGISGRLREIFDNISPDYNITVTAWEYREDRINVTFRAQPNTELTKFINAYKSAGSRLIKKEFPEIQRKLDNGQFWSRSFFLVSTGEIDENDISEYLSKQNPAAHKARKSKEK